MKGTFPYCRTKEVILWMNDGDIVQNLTSEEYFKKEDAMVFVSQNLSHWEEFNEPMEIFPPYIEWRSLTNLHYYKDIKTDKPLNYLTADERILAEEDHEANRESKRWFFNDIF
jgi:hypothetical protein